MQLTQDSNMHASPDNRARSGGFGILRLVVMN